MDANGSIVDKQAPDFTLPDHLGGRFNLHRALAETPVMLVFYPRDFSPVCTKQLCSYSDNMAGFEELGIRIVGISSDDVTAHSQFARRHQFPFLLCSDPDQTVAKSYGCTSLFMFGKASRGVFIVSRQRLVLHKHVEPTVLTHRSASELLGILQDLRAKQLI